MEENSNIQTVQQHIESCFEEDGSRIREPLLENQYELNMARLKKSKRRLIIAIVTCIIFMILEFIGGYIAKSYAIMSDAAHLFTDLSGFLISFISILVSEKSSTTRHTFGFYRFEVIGALFSVMLIWLFTGIVAYNAVLRFFELDKVEIDGKFMFILSIIGIVINIGLMFTFHGHDHDHDHGHDDKNKKDADKKDVSNHHHKHGEFEHEHKHPYVKDYTEIIEVKTEGDKEVEKRPKRKVQMNLNVEAAYLHALGDLIQSFGIIIASIFVWVNEKKFRWMDPAITLLFSVIVLYTTLNILKRSFAIVMESTPYGMSLSEIESQLMKIDGVIEVHDLHIWSLTDQVYCCSVHILIKEEKSLCRILNEAQNSLARHYINHSTVQLEHLGHQLKCLTSCREATLVQ